MRGGWEGSQISERRDRVETLRAMCLTVSLCTHSHILPVEASPMRTGRGTQFHLGTGLPPAYQSHFRTPPAPPPVTELTLGLLVFASIYVCVGVLDPGVTDSCELLCGCWELNLDPLEEHVCVISVLFGKTFSYANESKTIHPFLFYHIQDICPYIEILDTLEVELLFRLCHTA
ncbi:hypothetical protein STEG23_004216 [Scotinomys teguina]